MNGNGMETQQPRASRKRRFSIVSTLVGSALIVLLLGGAWKWGWFGREGSAEERVFDLGNGVKLSLCWCPPGKFLMGSPATEAGREATEWKEAQHEVTLTQGFWMAKTETTQAQWKAFMPGNPSHYKGDRLPVEDVTWGRAKAFAASLTDRLQKDGQLEPGWELRLPTEAQWEYACRAGTTTAYYIGDGEEALRKAGWYDGNSGRKRSRFTAWLQSLPVIHQWITVAPGGKPKPVGEKAENAFGLQDMHGNVWEWCEDSYSDYEETSVIDPVPSDGVNRISRGGCWMSYAEFCRSAGRHLTVPYFDCPGIGFRVCLVPGPAAGLQSAGQGIGGRGTAKGEEF